MKNTKINSVLFLALYFMGSCILKLLLLRSKPDVFCKFTDLQIWICLSEWFSIDGAVFKCQILNAVRHIISLDHYIIWALLPGEMHIFQQDVPDVPGGFCFTVLVKLTTYLDVVPLLAFPTYLNILEE